jgi:hypothetical protein
MNVRTCVGVMFGTMRRMFGPRRCATCGEEIDLLYCACAPRLTDTVRINEAVARFAERRRSPR